MIYPLLECPECKQKAMKLVTIVEPIEHKKHEFIGKLGVKCKGCGYTAVLLEPAFE